MTADLSTAAVVEEAPRLRGRQLALGTPIGNVILTVVHKPLRSSGLLENLSRLDLDNRSTSVQHLAHILHLSHPFSQIQRL